MRIEKITQYNSYNNEKTSKARDRQWYAGNEISKKQDQPAFCGFVEWLTDGVDSLANGVDSAVGSVGRFLGNLFDTDDRSKQRKSRYSQEYHTPPRARKQERPVRKTTPSVTDTVPAQAPVKPQTEEPVKGIVIPDRYALVDEYEKRTKARAEFREKTRGRALTPEEKAESDRLRLEWKEISDRIIPEHQSIVKTKTAADFANETEKKKYIMNYVLPRMNKSEESALDALDMFEQFGFRADYPPIDGSVIETTVYKLSNKIYAMPKSCRSDKLLKRFIEVYGKYADNTPRKNLDDEGLYCVLADYGKNGINIQEDTILKGIELMKKIACQKVMYEWLDNALVSGYNAKFKNSEPVKKALEELKVVVKDMKYRLGTDETC